MKIKVGTNVFALGRHLGVYALGGKEFDIAQNDIFCVTERNDDFGLVTLILEHLETNNMIDIFEGDIGIGFDSSFLFQPCDTNIKAHESPCHCDISNIVNGFHDIACDYMASR